MGSWHPCGLCLRNSSQGWRKPVHRIRGEDREEGKGSPGHKAVWLGGYIHTRLYSS